MKKVFAIIATTALVVSCSTNEEFVPQESFTLTGYTSAEARTAFDTPTASNIPFVWSAGDYIWLGSFQTSHLCTLSL